MGRERSEKHRFLASVFPEEFIHRSQFKTWVSTFIQQNAHNDAEAGKAFLSHGANTATWDTQKKYEVIKNTELNINAASKVLK